jgi:hypothetical protein
MPPRELFCNIYIGRTNLAVWMYMRDGAGTADAMKSSKEAWISTKKMKTRELS